MRRVARDRIREHFEEQIELSRASGSPFTGLLLERMVRDFDAGGPVADLIGAWPTSPRADALAMRVMGALHAAALSRRDPALAAEYPERRADWSMDSVLAMALG